MDSDAPLQPPSDVEPSLGVSGGGSTCSVCNSPLAPTVRGTALYRRSLAAARAGVCDTHLAGDHVVGGVLSRFCTNHHSWHALAAFGDSARATTCSHARSLAAVRAKQQRALKRRAGDVPAEADPGEEGGHTEQAGAPTALVPAASDVHPDAVREVAIGSGGGQEALLCTVPLVPSTAVAGVCATAEATAQFLALLEQSTGQQIVRCIAGAAAQACTSQGGRCSGGYALLCGVAPPLLHHNLTNLHNLQPVLASLVRQARDDEKSGAVVPSAAPQLADLLDRLVESANKRAAVVRRARGAWWGQPDVVCLFQEVLDGNTAHRHNVCLLNALLQGAALCASPEDHVVIVRLVAEWLHQQHCKLVQAVVQRLAWMSTVPAATTGLRGRFVQGVADFTAACVDLRQWWVTLVL